MNDPQSENPSHNRQQQRWLPDSDRASRFDDAELRQFRRDFRRVVRRTVGRATAERPQASRPRRSRAVAAASAFFLLILLAVLLRDALTPIEAAPISGLQGVVINGATGRSLSGVAVTALDSQGDKQFLDFTDAAGFFDVPPAPDQQSRVLRFELEGEEIGVLHAGSAEQQAGGFVRVVLPGPQLEQVTVAQVQLAPGETARLGAGLQLALDDSATGSWSGQLTQDPNWPSVFNFGQVLTGVFSAAGPASADLSLSVRIARQQLAFNAADAADVQLIALNAAYARDDEYRAFHRGWYVTDRATQDYLPHIELHREVTVEFADFSWQAEPGVQYALLLPPAKQGVLSALEFYDFDSRDSPLFTRIVHHCDLDRPQLALYRLFHQPTAGDGPWELTLQPTTHRLRYSLAGETWHAETGEKLLPLCPDDGSGHVPGKLWAEMYDFTLQNKIVFDSISVDIPPRENPYGLEFSGIEIGSVADLRVTGAASLPADSIAWDFTDDGVYDAWGQEARLPLLYSGKFKVAVYVQEPAGRTVKLARSIRIANRENSGWFWDQPVLAGREQPPAEQVAHLAMTQEMVANPQPYGYSTGLFAPQVMLIALPERFTQVPLKELRVYLYGTPQAGDVDQIYLAAHFLPLVSAEIKPSGTPQRDEQFFMNPAGFEGLDCASVSFAVESALKRQAAGGEWRAYLASRGQIEPIATGFQVFLGLDLANLPPDQELLAALRDFKDDPRYAIRYINQPNQEVAWRIDLRGGRIRSGGGIIAGISMETKGLLYNCQWQFMSGGITPARVEVETEDGEVLTRYFDYSLLD